MFQIMFKTFPEVCLTSNVISKTVPSFEDHHLKDLMEHRIPFSICVSKFLKDYTHTELPILWYCGVSTVHGFVICEMKLCKIILVIRTSVLRLT